MTTCDRCGREAEGFAVIGDRRLCHPDYGPSCDHLEPGTTTEVRAECLAYALDNEPLGVWGGMSPRERLAVRTEPMSKASRFAARCGTVGGRSAHQRRNETPCDAYREAYNEHERAKALRRRLAEGRG